MNKNIWIVIIAALVASFLFGSVDLVSANYEIPLIAGQNVEVGSVTVSDDGANLIVNYEITEAGWFLTETHLYADVKAPKKGAPGRFPFHSGDIYSSSYTFTIALADLGVTSGDDLVIAAHAVVENTSDVVGYVDAAGVLHNEAGYDCPTMGDITAALPVSSSIKVVSDGLGYYDVQFDLNGDGAYGVDETFDWYCIDKNHSISPNSDYTVRVFSSYETLPAAIVDNGTGDNNVDNPENLDLVNWVINNPGSLSQIQIQDVLWALVDDALTRENLDSASQVVYDAALLHDGFVPADGQKLAIVLQPVDASANTIGQVTISQVTIGQVTFGSLGMSCQPWEALYQSETGWAIAANDFSSFKGGWGGSFSYTVLN